MTASKGFFLLVSRGSQRPVTPNKYPNPKKGVTEWPLAWDFSFYNYDLKKDCPDMISLVVAVI